jgi:peptide/nickel transport system substrate-binding protein
MRILTERRLQLAVPLALALALGACTQPTEEPGPGAAATGSPEAATSPEAVTGGSQVPADTYVLATIGEPETMDPAWTYETAGSGLQANIYDSLLAFNKDKPDEFVPGLAESHAVSEDGLTYTFTIREGVTFHEGGTLEASDIAYSLHRAMLQDRLDGPMWLYLDPMLGAHAIKDYAFETAGLEMGEESTLADVPAETLAAVCEAVKATAVADNAARTLTITVMKPTPWFEQLLSQPWSAALDQEWMAEQGDWDGDCATWQDFHDPTADKTVLFNRSNGTGPYMLTKWTPQTEITLDANDNYWRTEEAWPGGPTGAPRIKHIVIQTVEEWGTRLAKLQAGEADTVTVPRANIDQVADMVAIEYAGNSEDAPATDVNPEGTLKLFKGFPSLSATALMFNQAVSTEGGNEFIGSGALDGEGIPPDFFSDINVRRGFNYCFDWETYIADALQGEGVQTRGPIIEGLQGYTEDNEIFEYDPEKCAEELSLAWDGALPGTGFKMTLAYNEGNLERQTVAQILAENLAAIDPTYQIEVQSLEWPSFLDARRMGKFPASVSGWAADYHHASNWVQPFMHSAGAYARAQNFPEELQTQIDTMFDEAIAATDEATATELYTELQALGMSEAINVWLSQATGRFYVDKRVEGWYNNPLGFTNYYAMSKSEG